MQTQLQQKRIRIPSDLSAASEAPGANLTHRLHAWPQAAMNFTGAFEWFAWAQDAPQTSLYQHTRRLPVLNPN